MFELGNQFATRKNRSYSTGNETKSYYLSLGIFNFNVVNRNLDLNFS